MEKVSVIIPCYNDGRYIEETIQSVLNQTYSRIEIIVIDDGSDNLEMMKTLERLKARGIIVLHTEHLGPSHARNYGIYQSTGEYILPLDSDDKINETYIEKAVRVLNTNEKIGAVYCRAELFGEKTGPWNLPDYELKKMFFDNIVFVTAMFRKEDWKVVGGFCSDFKHGMEDYDFWLSILDLGKEIYQIPEILFYYRIKKESRTSAFWSSTKNVLGTYQLIYKRHKVLFEKNCTRLELLFREIIVAARVIKVLMKYKLQK